MEKSEKLYPGYERLPPKLPFAVIELLACRHRRCEILIPKLTLLGLKIEYILEFVDRIHNSSSISGLVVKSVVAIDGPRVRFAANA